MQLIRQIQNVFCIIILCATYFIGCDVGFKEDKKDDETLKESNKILNEYKRVQGEYRGILNLSVDEQTSPVNIEIKLKPDISYGGRNDGELVPQVSLNGTFKILDFIWPFNSADYEGRYWYAQDGRILMADGKSELWFQVYPKQDQLVDGQLWGPNGLLGEFEATLVSKEVRAPGEGEEEEQRKRLRESYQSVLGNYTGSVSNPDDPEEHRRAMALDFHFYLAGSDLKANVAPTHSDLEILIRPLTVKLFRTDTGQIVLEGKARGVGTVPGYGEFYARGFLKDSKLILEEVSDHLGPLGTYLGEKTQSSE